MVHPPATAGHPPHPPIRYRVTLRADPRHTPADAVRALRAALKRLGRTYGLHCEQAVEVQEALEAGE